jgi:hypothetical protein
MAIKKMAAQQLTIFAPGPEECFSDRIMIVFPPPSERFQEQPRGDRIAEGRLIFLDFTRNTIRSGPIDFSSDCHFE